MLSSWSTSTPLAPRVTANVGAPALNDPRGIAVQFRYAFVVDRYGVKVLDVTELAHPKFVVNAKITLDDARNIYVARTYAYVAAGKDQEVTRFTFELPPGDYNVRVSCEGYKDARLLLSIQAGVEREQVVVLRWERRSGKEDDPEGRFAYFLQQ